ncbi:MAG TPA: energy transducer TonB [Bryobacteraceae bacterium]|nr:energy transducer TonB [Bryobacteraceae bacterium]
MQLRLRVRSSQVSAFNDLFETRVGAGIPPFRNFVGSIGVHLLAATCLAFIPSSPPPTFVQPRGPVLYPTELRIGEKLYYVTRIPPKQERRSVAAASAPKGASAPRAAAKAKSDPAPGSASSPPRKFIPPPEIKPDVVADQTLIQLESPPDLRAQDTPLPPFRAWTAQIPKIPKPFVTPGRPKTLPIDQPLVTQTPPPLEMVRADPMPIKQRPLLVLPPTPMITDAPPQASKDATPTSPVGDPVNIFSASANPPVAADRLVIPPGNLVALEQSGGKGNNSRGSGIEGSGSGSGPSPSGAGAGFGNGTSPTAGTLAGTGGGAARTGTGSGIGTSPGPGTGTGTAAGPGTGTAAGRTAGVSSGANSGVPGGTGTGAPKKVIIIPPENGNFDAVVTQSAPLDMFPESRGLLSGRPVYSVYLSVGTPKDWALYFCVPNEKAPESGAGTTVVQLTAVTPVKAPYPLKMARPVLSLPSYYKYLLVRGYVTPQGKVQTIRIVTPVSPEFDAAVLDSLQDWVFRAATRDGVSIAVEFLLVIPRAGI